MTKGDITVRPALTGLLVLATVPLTLAQEPASAPPPPSTSRYLGLHEYPAKDQIAAQQQELDGFKKAYGARMEAKSYVVK